MRQPKILTTIQDYSWQQFWADSVAGVTVAMVAMPLSLAIAIASGAAPAQGLVTAIVAGFFVSLIGGSRVQIGGPTGAFIVVVFAAISEHGYDGLVMATFMAGLILVVAGYLRMGRLIAYVPEAVINGFTLGIAIIIATSQLKDFLGLNIGKVPADIVELLPILWVALDDVNEAAILIAMATMAAIVALRRLSPRIPGLIIAVAVASAAVALQDMPVETIQSRFGAFPGSLPVPKFPDFSFERIQALLPTACVIAFLAGVESLLSALVADRMIGSAHRSNAEVLAQGVANVASSLFGGLPATGAIARTATNVRAGGRTPVAGIVHALVILVVMMAAATLAGYLAMPALAALLILTAWNMSEPHKWKEYLRSQPSDRLLLLVTLGLTVAVDLTVAIAVGVGIGFALRLKQRTQPPSDWTTPKR